MIFIKFFEKNDPCLYPDILSAQMFQSISQSGGFTFFYRFGGLFHDIFIVVRVDVPTAVKPFFFYTPSRRPYQTRQTFCIVQNCEFWIADKFTYCVGRCADNAFQFLVFSLCQFFEILDLFLVALCPCLYVILFFQVLHSFSSSAT